jgi:hypothetical protein
MEDGGKLRVYCPVVKNVWGDVKKSCQYQNSFRKEVIRECI